MLQGERQGEEYQNFDRYSTGLTGAGGITKSYCLRS